jgi:hypothetical protein
MALEGQTHPPPEEVPTRAPLIVIQGLEPKSALELELMARLRAEEERRAAEVQAARDAWAAERWALEGNYARAREDWEKERAELLEKLQQGTKERGAVDPVASQQKESPPSELPLSTLITTTSTISTTSTVQPQALPPSPPPAPATETDPAALEEGRISPVDSEAQPTPKPSPGAFSLGQRVEAR